MINIPVGIRGAKQVGVLISAQAAQSRGQTMQNEVLVPNQQISLTAICVVALPGKFIVIPIDQLVPLIDIQVNEEATAETDPAETEPTDE